MFIEHYMHFISIKMNSDATLRKLRFMFMRGHKECFSVHVYVRAHAVFVCVCV